MHYRAGLQELNLRDFHKDEMSYQDNIMFAS